MTESRHRSEPHWQLVFYLLNSEYEPLTPQTARLVLRNVVGEELDRFVADYDPYLSVLSREDFAQELAKIEGQGPFSWAAQQDIEWLKVWVRQSDKPVVGYQFERVD